MRAYLLLLYDHLGAVVLVNVAWLAASVPWFLAAGALSWVGEGLSRSLGEPALSAAGVVAGLTLIALSPATLVVYCVTHGWVSHDGAGRREAWARARPLLLRAQTAGLLVTLAVLLLAGNALFYQAWGGWVGLALSGVMLWLLVGLALLAILLFPVIVANPEMALRAVLRHAALLLLDNPGRCLRLGAATLLCLILGAVSGVGLALGGLTATALAGSLGLRHLLVRYGGAPVERDGRGVTDLLRPWQS